MTADNSSLTKRHALLVALIYLVIRGFPELLYYGSLALPNDVLIPMLQNHGYWLQHFHTILPLRQLSVPYGFQHAFASLMPLLLEVVLVFLFSAWFLRRGPRADGSARRKSWLALILVTLVWSYLIRLQLLYYFRSLQIEEIIALEQSDKWLDELPAFLMRAHFSFSALLYASIPLWALPPVWAHFRFAGGPAQPGHGGAGMALPLWRSVVFAAFFLGFLILHALLIQAVYMGLWPWAVELSGAHIPHKELETQGLPLTLSQIVAAALVGALAAYVYACRVPARATSGLGAFIKPALAGMMAYALTSLIMLVLFWLASYAQPDLIHSFVRDIERGRQDGMELLIVVNVLSLILLCVVSWGLSRSPRRWIGAALALLVCAAVPVYVGWVVASTNMGKAGGRPGEAITGTLGDARWRNMEQWCTGVVETRHDTWLVGRYELRRDPDYIPDGTPDLSELVYPPGQDERRRGRGLFSRSYLTTLARLQDDGSFKLEATIPEVACLTEAPESDTLFLFTGLNTPSESLYTSRNQDAVFRSTDRGANWEWLESGFMPEIGRLGSSFRPIFTSGQDVWAWGQESSALFYSADQGRTAAPIDIPEPLVAPVEYLREITGAGNGDFSGRRGDMDREAMVVQVSGERAYAWVSETMWYRNNGDSDRLGLHTRATLTRGSAQDPWKVAEVTRVPHVHVKHASTSVDGRTYGIVQNPEGEWLARLDPATGEWTELRALPTVLPGWLAEDYMSTRYFWNNGDYQVISLWGDIELPRLLLPFLGKDSEVSVDAHFYTRDGGRNWHQLAIPDYLGVMGLSSRGSKLYWTKGNWYEDNEPVQRHYDLAQ